MAASTTTLGSRRSVATYATYGEAEHAVDRLSDAGFPVDRVAIVGSGLRTVEQVTNRMTTGRAALLGAGQGAIIGVFFALLFGIFFTGPGFLGLLAYAVIVSAFFGACFGALAQAANGGRRDFSSFQRMEAERYEVMVDQDVAARATQIIEGRTLDSEPAVPPDAESAPLGGPGTPPDDAAPPAGPPAGGTPSDPPGTSRSPSDPPA